MLLLLLLMLLVLLLVLVLLIQSSIAGFGVRFLVDLDQIGAAASPRTACTAAVRVVVVMVVVSVVVIQIVVMLHPVARFRHLQHAL